MTKREKFGRDLGKLIDFAHDNDINIITYSLFRTVEDQKKLFESGKSHCDGVNNLSKHQLGRAVDLVIMENGKAVWERNWKYEKLGDFWKSLGNKWGGDWKTLNDIYHFEV